MKVSKEFTACDVYGSLFHGKGDVSINAQSLAGTSVVLGVWRVKSSSANLPVVLLFVMCLAQSDTRCRIILYII